MDASLVHDCAAASRGDHRTRVMVLGNWARSHTPVHVQTDGGGCSSGRRARSGARIRTRTKTTCDEKWGLTIVLVAEWFKVGRAGAALASCAAMVAPVHRDDSGVPAATKTHR